MKSSKIFAAIALLAGFYVTASAQVNQMHLENHARTRQQVRAELNAAIAHGDMIANYETSENHRDSRPDLYPRHDTGSNKTRAEVNAELQEARRLGLLPVDGDSGVLMKDRYPENYAKAAQTQKSRVAVIAELKEAQRIGTLLVNGESNLKLKDLFPGNYPNAH